jgi:hypothetical protein
MENPSPMKNDYLNLVQSTSSLREIQYTGKTIFKMIDAAYDAQNIKKPRRFLQGL